jgi:hypothetical protein
MTYKQWEIKHEMAEIKGKIRNGEVKDRVKVVPVL